jgi:hypothetical protein
MPAALPASLAGWEDNGAPLVGLLSARAGCLLRWMGSSQRAALLQHVSHGPATGLRHTGCCTHPSGFLLLPLRDKAPDARLTASKPCCRLGAGYEYQLRNMVRSPGAQPTACRLAAGLRQWLL